MNDYINANKLFTLKMEAEQAENANKRIYVRELLRRQFSDHLIKVTRNPQNAGQLYFPIKSNDINGKYILSNTFLRENTKLFQDYLNEEFKSSNYYIELKFRSCSDFCYCGDYRPLTNKISKKSFWSFLSGRM